MCGMNNIMRYRAMRLILLPIDLCAALLAAALYLAQIVSLILPYVIHVWTIWMSWDISKNFLHHSTWSAITSAAITAATPVITEAIFVYKIGFNSLYGLAIMVAVVGYFRLFALIMLAPMAYLRFRYNSLRGILRSRNNPALSHSRKFPLTNPTT